MLIDRGTAPWKCILPLVLLVLVVLVAVAKRSRMEVILSNATDTPLTALELRYRGGMAAVSVLEVGASASVTVRPTGDSGLQVTYIGADGRRTVNNPDVYIAPGLSGQIVITLQDSGTFTVSQTVKVSGPLTW